MFLLGCAVSPAAITGVARAHTYLPPRGKVFTGVADKPVLSYETVLQKHPAVYEEFVAWGQYLPGITADATNARARAMLSITTAFGSRQAITPAGIAAGDGDAWLIGLGEEIYDSGNVTYVRLMAEMDQASNPYCAFNANGSSRGPSHSAAEFKRAWQRATLILRGGRVSSIDRELHRLRMPALNTSLTALPAGKVAMLWVPQVAGAPAVAGNRPQDYWPGRRWVDWVGTDFYSRFQNWSGLDRLYDAYPRFPFVFGEYALWGRDDPAWISALFSWTRSHARTRMMIYNQGTLRDGPFALSRYPKGARELRNELSGAEFPGYAPEWEPRRAG